jgi:hypothetical protein
VALRSKKLSMHGCGYCESDIEMEASLYEIATFRYTSAAGMPPCHDCCRSGRPSNSGSIDAGGGGGSSRDGCCRDGSISYCGGVGPADLRLWLLLQSGVPAGFARRPLCSPDEHRRRHHEAADSDTRYADMRARLEATAPAARDALFPPRKACVLRNLSARQIVRAEALTRGPHVVCGSFVGLDNGGISFGDVVALRTRFGCEGIRQMLKKETIEHAGVWAGRAFDITTLERHEREEHAELASWRDVSAEVAHEMRRLWETLNKSEC